MLALHLLRNRLPAVTLQIGPQFDDINHSAALQSLIANIQRTVVGDSLLVEEVVCFCTVARIHEPWIFAHEKGRLQWHYQPLVRIECD